MSRQPKDQMPIHFYQAVNVRTGHRVRVQSIDDMADPGRTWGRAYFISKKQHGRIEKSETGDLVFWGEGTNPPCRMSTDPTGSDLGEAGSRNLGPVGGGRAAATDGEIESLLQSARCTALPEGLPAGVVHRRNPNIGQAGACVRSCGRCVNLIKSCLYYYGPTGECLHHRPAVEDFDNPKDNE